MDKNQKFNGIENFAQRCVDINGRVEVVNWDLYDTVMYPPEGIDRLYCFREACGMNAKTLLETNLYSPSSLPTPCAFWCDGFALDADARFAVMLEQGYFQFIIAQKVYAQIAPLGMLKRYTQSTLIDGIERNKNNYIPYVIAPGLGIAQGMNFGVELVFPHAPPMPYPVPVRITLCGHLFRPVQ